jgi:hypothetical protein
MCLCGVDYFSTLGYQPSIAFEGAGILSPIATLVLVAVTLFGALPIYCHVAGETPDGVGSVGMIERIFRGWTSKIFVLVLVGFAATDFVITKTLSAADATAHLLSNPLFMGSTPEWMHSQIAVTMFLLVLLSAMFIKGYGEVVGLATLLVVTYIGLTAIVIGAGLLYLMSHPELTTQWINQISNGDYHLHHSPISGKGPWVALLIACLIFPKLALGMSGFETGVLHIHLIRGKEDDPSNAEGRIRRTRLLLITAALIMSVMLLGSSLVTGTGTLIPAEEFRMSPERGKAVDRALAYIAHGESPFAVCPLFGSVFGTVYDISTILILWFAGASAMAGLLNMVPRYLPRYGMAPEWAAAYRPLVIAFTVVNLLVTWCFRADVSSQGGAYATGVLVLMTSASIGSLVDLSRKPRPAERSLKFRRKVMLAAFGLISLVFVYTTAANIVERPDGIIIASIFIACVMCMSIISRIWRSRELRLNEFRFENEGGKMLWTDLCADGGFRVLIPHRPGSRSLADKEIEVRRKHRIPAEVPLLFLEVHSGDTSEFHNTPVISVRQEDGRFILVAREVASVSHTIAQIAIELGKSGAPLDIVFGWSIGNSMQLAIQFVLFGQGDVPNSVFDLLEHAIPDPIKRPTVLVG